MPTGQELHDYVENGNIMTNFLYYENAYLQEFGATITEVDSSTDNLRVALDCTAFYPGGGGQPNDQGWLTLEGTRYEVTKVKREGSKLWPA